MQEKLDRIKVASARALARRISDALDAANAQIATQTSGYVGAKTPSIKEESDAVLQRFKRHLYAYFDRLASAPDSAEDVSPESTDSISLLDHDYIEAMIAMDGMIRQMREREAAAAAEFVLHLQRLNPARSVDQTSNPLDPEQIGDCFNQAIRPLGLKAHFLLTIYREFNKHVFGKLDEILGELNQLIAAFDELPERERTTQPDEQTISAQAIAQSKSAAEQSSASADTEDTRPSQQVDVHHLLNTIQAEADTSKLPLHVDPQRIAPTRNDAIYPGLQRTLALLGVPDATTAPAVLRQLAEQLQQALNSDDVPSIDQQSLNTLNLVILFYQGMIEDSKHAEAACKLLLATMYPFCRAALSDPGLFSALDHPALQLLDLVAHASIGWTNHTVLENEAAYQTLQQATHTTSSIEATDRRAWAELCESLSRSLQMLSARQVSCETGFENETEGSAPQKHAPEQLEQQEVAEVYVQSELHARVLDDKLDPAIRNLLDTHFRNALLKIVEREGRTGKSWHPVMLTVDVMLWSVQETKQAGDRARFEKIRDRLMANIEKALQFSAASQTKIRRAMRQLRQIQDYTFLKAESQAEPETPVGPFLLQQFNEVLLAADDPDLLGSEAYRAGDWFQITDENNQPQRLTLAVRIDSIEKFIFTDQQGHKALELSSNCLIGAVKAGAVRYLGDGQVTARALRRLILALQPARLQ